MSIFNFKKAPKAFLLSILLIIAFEIVIWSLDQNYLLSETTEGLRIKVKNRFSQTKNNNFDILILGDCYPGLGIQTKLIEERTGLKSFNFSTYVWQTALASYAFLKHYLQNSPKPKVIIISFNSWGAAFSKEEILQERIPYFYDFSEGNEDLLTQEFGFVQGIRFRIPSVSKQDIIQKILRSPLQVGAGNLKAVKDFIESVQNERGFDPSYIDKPYNYWRMTPYKYPLSDFFKRYLKQIIKLCKTNGIPIIYIKPSLPKEYFDFEEKQYHISELYDNFISSLAMDYQNIIILDLQDMLSDSAYYQSKQHLNRKGSLIISEYLAKYLQSKFSL